MNINEQFPSKFIKEADLQGQPRVLTMARVTVEAMDQTGGDTKPVVYFQGAKKGLALNITNKNVIVLLYGTETDNWIGKQIELYPSQTDFRGEVVACIRCRIPGAVGALAAAPAAAPAPLPATDGVHTPTVTPPFAPAKQATVGGTATSFVQAGEAAPKPMSEEISDEIPF